MASDDDVLSLVNDIYDAALDESAWQRVMEEMLAVTDSQAATFSIIDNSSNAPRFSTFVTTNFDPLMVTEYLGGMSTQDPTVEAIAANPRQKIFHDSALITEREKDRHAYYNWHEKFSDTRHRIAGMASPAETIQAGITVHRTRLAGDFDPQTKKLIALLFRHIEQALLIGFRLGTLGALNEFSSELLDRNPAGVILLDDQGRIVMANRAATEIEAARDGLAMAGGSVKLLRRSDDRRLQEAIGGVLNAGTGVPLSPHNVMAVPRPSGKRAYMIAVSPVSSARFMMSTIHPAACVLVVDPEREPTVPEHRLRTLYGLSRGEARLAALLARGDDLKTAAEALSITYATARARLSAVFRKTETSRQSELLKLLLATVPILLD